MIKGKLFLSDNEVKTIDGWKVPYVNGEDAKLFSYTVTLCCNCISCDNISTIFMISGFDKHILWNFSVKSGKIDCLIKNYYT